MAEPAVQIAPPPEPRPAPAATPATLAPRNRLPLGQILLEDGAVDPGNLLKAVVMRQRQDARLGRILLAHGWVAPEALLRALTRQWRTSAVDPAAMPADPRLIDAAGAEFCLAHGVLPWRRVAGVTWVATARPERFEDLVPLLPAEFGRIRMLLCSEEQAQAAILSTRRTRLIRRAESRVPAIESCRARNEARAGRLALGLAAAAALGLWFAPVAFLALLTAWVVLALVAQCALKLLAFGAALRLRAEERGRALDLARGKAVAPEIAGPLPVISVMVPLFRESDVAGRLVARLARLDYPRELTDILLVIEEGDAVTRAALKDARLPFWIRVVEVPEGPIQTKPRALNYALNFCQGGIVGIWDAEDRPDRDQLHRVARGFHGAPRDLACLQGALDYYNPRSNWLARCFTVEYAALFRVVLPGLARMGLVVPLGGTTMFVRRDVLEAVGGWDAWNVTEDADLGVRLARRRWRTGILDTTTDEEANCRAVPWIRQRSRWLKGYAMTWGVHMRDPAALWRDLGARRFVAFQVQFLGMLSLYLLAPVLWSFWLLAAALPHPLRAPLEPVWGGHAAAALFGLFFAAEMLNMAIGFWAVRGPKHRHLLGWVPSLHLYFPLGCLAGWKAVYEIVAKPFYWDKTAHGIFGATVLEAPAEAPAGDGATVGLPLLGRIGGRSLDDIAGDGDRNPGADPAAARPALAEAEHGAEAGRRRQAAR